MPTYQVIRCASDTCSRFQTQQQKKTNKWKCVVCGLSQSLKRVYFESTKPSECRPFVMQLNMATGSLNGQKPLSLPVHTKQPEDSEPDQHISKWTEFVCDPEDDQSAGLDELGRGFADPEDIPSYVNRTNTKTRRSAVRGVRKDRRAAPYSRRMKNVREDAAGPTESTRLEGASTGLGCGKSTEPVCEKPMRERPESKRREALAGDESKWSRFAASESSSDSDS